VGGQLAVASLPEEGGGAEVKAMPPPNFGLLENCKKIFFWSQNSRPRIQYLSLKILLVIA